MTDTSGGYLLTTSGEWVDLDGQPWIVDTEWAELDGRAECVSVKLSSARLWPPDGQVGGVRSGAEPRAITALRWRAVPIASVIAEQRRSINQELDVVIGLEGRTIAEMTSAPAAFGGRRLSAEQLETTKRAYRAAYSHGLDTGPAVRDAFAAVGDYISVSTARNRIEAARRKGLLPPTTRGRARA